MKLAFVPPAHGGAQTLCCMTTCARRVPTMHACQMAGSHSLPQEKVRAACSLWACVHTWQRAQASAGGVRAGMHGGCAGQAGDERCSSVAVTVPVPGL